MAVYDISVPIRPEIVLYPGEEPPSLRFTAHLGRGDNYTVSRLELGSHTGTHIDAPLHFLEDGASIDCAPVDLFSGTCDVVDLTDVAHGNIGAAQLRAWDPRSRIVLLKTRNSAQLRAGAFRDDYCSLELDGADEILARNVQVVGIDWLSIETADTTEFPVHKRLLSHGVYVIEGLQLANVPAGRYELVCLPLYVSAAEAAPARAYLRSLA